METVLSGVQGFISEQRLLVIALVFLMLPLISFIRSQLLYKKYKARGQLLTFTEQKSFKVFDQYLMGTGCRVMAQVRIADVISVTGRQGSVWWKAFKSISSKHVDFVVVDHAFRIKCAIEVDDASHSKKDRMKRDLMVDRVFKSAGVSLLRCKPGSERNILGGIKQCISR